MTPAEESAWKKSIEEEDEDEAVSKLQSWIQPRTDGYFQAPSEHRLHVRAVMPPGDADARTAKAVLLYCHGLNSHVNGKVWNELYDRIAGEGGIALFAVDIMGHGYSEGTRNFVPDWGAVFEDLEAFVEALMGTADPPPTSAEFNPGVSGHTLSRLRQLPIFVTGTSLGGMIGMYVSQRLQNNPCLEQKFKGAVFCCPALVVDLPPQPVQILLRNVVVPLFRTRQMPSAVSSSSKSVASWAFDLSDPKQKEIAEMEIRDCAFRYPDHALGWQQGMLWGTAGAFSNVYSHLDEDMQEVEFPFLLIHDREDKICFFSGSEKLMELSPSTDKTLREIDAGGRHCVPVVVQDQYLQMLLTWIKQRLK